MKNILKSALVGIGLTIGLAGTASAASATAVPYWTFTQDQPDGQMYFFVNIGPGQIAYYIGDNHAIATMVDNAGHAAANITVTTDASSRITQVGGSYTD